MVQRDKEGNRAGLSPLSTIMAGDGTTNTRSMANVHPAHNKQRWEAASQTWQLQHSNHIAVPSSKLCAESCLSPDHHPENLCGTFRHNLSKLSKGMPCCSWKDPGHAGWSNLAQVNMAAKSGIYPYSTSHQYQHPAKNTVPGQSLSNRDSSPCDKSGYHHIP